LKRRSSPNEKIHDTSMYVPLYVGIPETAQYPITKAYARAMLIVHQPWHAGRKTYSNGNPEDIFKEFIATNSAPETLILNHYRAQLKYKRQIIG